MIGKIYRIYIPIWLDLLLIMLSCQSTNYYDLHSNMVRFIMYNARQILYRVVQIYIPIWLDLL